MVSLISKYKNYCEVHLKWKEIERITIVITSLMIFNTRVAQLFYSILFDKSWIELTFFAKNISQKPYDN
jgi:hypothetical protein